MFRVFAAGRCHPPNELTVLIAAERVRIPPGQIATKTPALPHDPARDFCEARSFSHAIRCDEKSLLGSNGVLDSIGHSFRR